MMKAIACLTLGFLFGVLGGVWSPAIARDGLYLGLDVGMTIDKDISVSTGGEDDWENTPISGRCDRTVNPDHVQIAPTDCGDEPRPWGPMFESFDGAVGVMTGAVAGYQWKAVRLEAEYFYRTTNVQATAVPTSATYDPRDETQLAFVQDRIDTVSGHHGFVNLYYDVPLSPAWTVYLGAGIGVAAVDVQYSTNWQRSEDPDEIQVFDPSTPEGLALNTKLAGTASYDRSVMQDTLMGYQVLAGVDLVAAVDARVLEHVENRAPARGEFGESRIHQSRRSLRPRVHHRPEQGTGERDMRRETEVRAGPGREFDLCDGPLGAFGRLAVEFGRGETVEQAVVGRVHRDQLAFEVGGEFGDLDAAVTHATGQLIAVGLALGRLGDIDERRVADGHLDAHESQVRRPLRHGLDVVERILVGHELGEKDRRSLECLHLSLLPVSL